MPDVRITELEGLLLAANQSVALLTKTNADPPHDLAASQMRNKKLKRNPGAMRRISSTSSP
jgi:hypothetical protein